MVLVLKKSVLRLVWKFWNLKALTNNLKGALRYEKKLQYGKR